MPYLIPVVGLLIGLFVGLRTQWTLPPDFAQYLSIAVLAALDSVFGGIRAGMEYEFDLSIFVSGFFTNILLAAGLTYIGTLLGVDLYLAAVFAFGVRLFQNLAIIRRLGLEQLRKRRAMKRAAEQKAKK